jgi:large repetitive protein
MKNLFSNAIALLFVSTMIFSFTSCEETEVGSGPIIHTNKTITIPEIWKPENNPHTISGVLVVSDVILTIEPGTIIRMQAGARIEVMGQNGGIVAPGTIEKPIIFTSDASNPKSGDWDYILFNESSNTSTFSFCTFEYGGGSTNYGTIHIDGTKITVTNCHFRHSNSYGISCYADQESGFNEFKGNLMTEIIKNPIVIHANSAHNIGTGNAFTAVPGILIKGSSFTNPDATWSKQTVPYIIDNNLSIAGANTPTLRIAPGTTIQLNSGGSISVGGNGVYGQLIAEGTAEEKIFFTSNATNPQAGDWHYIHFEEGATDCILNHTMVTYGGGSTNKGMIEITNNALVDISNSTFRYSANTSIKANIGNGFRVFEFNSVLNENTHPLWIAVDNIPSIGQGNIIEAPAHMGIKVGYGSNLNRVTRNTVWEEQTVPFYFERNIEIRNNATLTIEPGVALRFAHDRAIEVGVGNEDAKLIAVGTIEKPITFMSAASSPQAGNWRGIRFMTNTLPGSVMDYCIVKHGAGLSSYNGNITIEPCGDGNPVIKNSEFSDSAGFGIFKKKVNSQTGNPTLENNTFSNNVAGDVN